MRDETTTVRQLRDLLEAFVAEREWHKFHDAKNLSMSIAIEAAELMEHFQWIRSEELVDLREDAEKMAEIREELADVAAYLLALTNVLGVDLASSLEEKMRKNSAKYPADTFRGRYYKP